MIYLLLFFGTLFAEQIQLGGAVLDVEIADTNAKRQKGLMGRTELSDGEGMLFIFPKKGILTFWMKNTLMPLSIAFFNENKKLIQMADMDPEDGSGKTIYRSNQEALYALEVPLGWFQRNEITLGAKFSFLDSR